MQVVIATGIYPRDMGGRGIYVKALAEELTKKGHEVVVIAYGQFKPDEKRWKVVTVPYRRKPLLRWFLFARELKKYARDADIVEAFSSVSAGVPVMIARLTKPKKVLRLGGDFMWERYTGRGGKLGLRDWYQKKPKSIWLTERLLRTFDHIIFSTEFEQGIYRKHYRMKGFSVLENALPNPNPIPNPSLRSRQAMSHPMRLLFVGRFVKFKNLPALIEAITKLQDANLTIVGEGPESENLKALVERLSLQEKVLFVGTLPREQLHEIFRIHDLMVIPSITEISPNVALEARASSLPVLLSKETGLSPELSKGMVLRDLSTSELIADAILEVEKDYVKIADSAAEPVIARGWDIVANEHLKVFESLLNNSKL